MATDGDAETYWILDPEQLRALGSARRHDIVDHLAAAGPSGIRDLAHRIGAHPSALYHHMRRLLAVGLIVEAGHRVRNRKRETLYATPAKRMRFYRALQDPKNNEIFTGVVGALTRQADRDFSAGIVSPNARPSREDRNLGLFRLISSPSASTLALINAHLAAVFELMLHSSGGEGDRMALTWIMAPLDGDSTDEPDDGDGRPAKD